MKNKGLILSTGLAMFSMFFGSGNLVFPLLVGQQSQGHFVFASLGIFATGVLVPFLGILAMMLFQGSTHHFFGRFGKTASFWFPFICLSLMGPFGVLARCITVAHGAFKLMIPETSLISFSVLSCLVMFFLTIRKSKIVPLLGSFLTPVLLLSLCGITFFALRAVNLADCDPKTSLFESFGIGAIQGYQTMDLLAAFFFSTFLISHLHTHKVIQENPKLSLPIFFKSSLIGAGLLAIIYYFLVLMGSMYANQLSTVPPQEMLGFIAQKTIGPFAAPVVCIAVILACLTTGLVLTSLFADFIRKEISKEKLSNPVCILITLLIALSVSTLEFSGIARCIGPILEVMYPALIVLCITSIFEKTLGWKAVKLPTAIALGLKLIVNAL